MHLSIKQTLSTVIFFMLVATIAKAASESSLLTGVPTAAPIIERWGTTPKLFAKAAIYGSVFNIRTQFSLDESIGLNKVEKLLRREDLIKKYISNVRSAQFTKPGPRGNFTFGIEVANFWRKKFSEVFKCRDVHKKGDSKTVLDQDCYERPTKKSSPLLTGAVFTTDCFVIKSVTRRTEGFSARHPGLQCDFGLAGKTHDARSWLLGTLPGSKIAYDLFTALTSYTAQIGMRAGGNLGPCPHTDRNFLSCTVFSNEIYQLKARKKGLKMVSPSETYVVSLNPDGAVDSHAWYGDYAVESYTDIVANNQSGM